MSLRFAGKWLVVLLTLFVSVVGYAKQIKVVSLNIEWFPGQKPLPTPEEEARHILDVSKTLAILSPDIFIAVEICDGTKFNQMLKSITSDLEMKVVSNFTDVEAGGNRRNQQIAIASRLEAIAGWAEPWQHTITNIRRGFSFAAIKNPQTGKLILVYGLHLKSNRNGNPEEEKANYDIRDASIDQLLAHMQKMEEQFAKPGIDGWIVAGDFNTNHDGKFGDHVIEKMVNAGFVNTWKNTDPENRHTWKGGHDDFKPITFDYILTKGLGELNATLEVVPPEVSDHNAVVLTIDLPGKDDEETAVKPAEVAPAN